MSADPVVALHGVSVGYEEHPVVHDVDLALRRGEVMAVLGANGSGKTTLVRGLLGLANVLTGTVELFGVPAAEFRDRRRLGYVPQRHTVAGTVPVTVTEVVASGRLPMRRAFRRATARDRGVVREVIETVGLRDHADAPVATLSGGQQRRVLIARALAGEPDVLVMDEPTAGVDAASQQALAQTLSLLVERGVTLLVVTHEVGPLASLVTRAVVMADGTISYDGPLTPALAGTADEAGFHEHGAAPPPVGSLGLSGDA